MLALCFGERKKVKVNDDIYYCTSCKKDFNCLYTHVHSDKHVNSPEQDISENIREEIKKGLVKFEVKSEEKS